MKKIIIILFLFSISTVQAASLGSIQKNNYAQISRGETATFTILLYNNEAPISVTLNGKKVPEKWTLIIKPESFILNQTLPEEPPFDENAEYFNTPNGPIRTSPVKIYVKSPRSAKPGEYEILISAVGGNPSGGLSVFQEKVFKFTVNVGKKGMLEEFLDVTSDNLNKLTGMVTAVDEQGNVLLLFVSFAVIIGISWFIKRRL